MPNYPFFKKAFSAERVFFARRGLTMFISVALRFLENVYFVVQNFEPVPPNPFSAKHMRYVFNGWVMVLVILLRVKNFQIFDHGRAFVGWFGG